jgi:cob(I)alamin adenosyltransferase
MAGDPTAPMVYLNRIYTRTGDGGETGLGDGTRVPKTHPRIVAYGGVDELNSVLGMVLTTGLPETTLASWLSRIQNDLFDVGADLCVPLPEGSPEYPQLRVTAAQVEQLEHWIDAATARLQPLTSFILPGGSVAAAQLHVARTVCRRVEIDVLRLVQVESINPHSAIYLNRLSDLLFVLARLCNDEGRGDVQWVPGRNRLGGDSGPG